MHNPGKMLRFPFFPNEPAPGSQMSKHKKTVSAALMMGALLVVLSGCQKQEGPAERAGKEVDKATEKAGQQIEKTGQNIQDAATGDKK